jgi:hypothetical protein
VTPCGDVALCSARPMHAVLRSARPMHAVRRSAAPCAARAAVHSACCMLHGVLCCTSADSAWCAALHRGVCALRLVHGESCCSSPTPSRVTKEHVREGRIDRHHPWRSQHRLGLFAPSPSSAACLRLCMPPSLRLCMPPSLRLCMPAACCASTAMVLSHCNEGTAAALSHCRA